LESRSFSIAGKENLGVGGRVLFTAGEIRVGLCVGDDLLPLVFTGGGDWRFELRAGGGVGVGESLLKLVWRRSGERGAMGLVVEKAEVGGVAAL